MSNSTPAQLDSSKLTITRTQTPTGLPPLEELVFGKTFTDHMLTVEWNAHDGWLAPRIIPYQTLNLDPSSSVFHYAFECFEGMKAYRDSDGQIRLFRPDRNARRLNQSASRIALPTVDEKEFIKILSAFVKLESGFVPDKNGYSLYLRPTMISTQNSLGVTAPKSALLYIIACPVGPYYPTGFKAISLQATNDAIRAWPGGVGDKKVGGNYAPCIVPQLKAAARGYDQNLWLIGKEEYVTEVGTMNLFIALENGAGERELVTAPIDGIILEGVTRDSVLRLARARLVLEGWVVSERKIRMGEVVEAAGEGRLLEVFGCGTAALICPVWTINYMDKDIECGLGEDENAGPLTLQITKWMEEIQYGEVKHAWSYVL